MTYLTLVTAAGHRLMVDPKKKKSLFWSLQDAQIAEGRLQEKQLSYEKYRMQRGVVQESTVAVSIAQSVRAQLDLLDETAFKDLDAGILALAERPDAPGSKPKHYRWFLDDLRRTLVSEFPIVYRVSEGGACVNIMNIGFRQWPKAVNTARRKQTTQAVATSRLNSKRAEKGQTKQKALKRTDQFIAYCGETPEELFSYPVEGQIHALVQAFREGIQQKAQQRGDTALTDAEQFVLAVTALQQEVNNGGFDQFLRNESRKFAPIVVQSLRLIGCREAAQIAETALEALHSRRLNEQAIEAAMSHDDPDRDEELNRCDQLFYRTQKGMAERVYAFIRAHRQQISFP